jgi:hypothetical protein
MCDVTGCTKTHHDRAMPHANISSAFKKIKFFQLIQILWHIGPLLGNDREPNNGTVIARQRPLRQWTGWKALISAGSAPMAPHTMDTIRSSVFYAVGAEGL